MSLKTFIDQCYKRKIFKGFSIYAISSWVIIQVAATTFPYLGIPRTAVTFIIILVLIGLPISLIFSWYYNVVPDELDEEQKEESSGEAVSVISDKAVSNIFKALMFVIIAVVLTIIVYMVKRNFSSEIERVASNRIAVIDFTNASGNEEHDLLGKIIADWIEHGIIGNRLSTVVSSDVIKNYESIIASNPTSNLSSEVLGNLKVEKTITGGLYKDGDNLIVKCSIYEWPNREAAYAFEDVKIDLRDPNVGINNLTNKVLGYLHSSDNQELRLQSQPPNYEAYKLTMKAQALLGSSDPEAINLLEDALQIDSNYFEAKVLQLSYYYGAGEYEKADSLKQTFSPLHRTDPRQVNLLNFYEALLSGKNKTIYETWKREYDIAPFDIYTNQTMMVLAMQYAYRPKEIQSIYEEINMESFDFSVCPSCVYRSYTMALAYLELKRYDKAIEVLKPFKTVDADPVIIKALITAYVRSKRYSQLKILLKDIPNLMLDAEMSEFYYKAGRELQWVGKKTEGAEYLQQAKADIKEENYVLARILMMEEDYIGAKRIFENLEKENQLSTKGKGYLGYCYVRGKDEKKLKRITESLNESRPQYDFGDVDYALAIIEAAKDNQEKALYYLRECVSKGYIYGPEEFQYELDFHQYKDSDEFQKLLKYWHY